MKNLATLGASILRLLAKTNDYPEHIDKQRFLRSAASYLRHLAREHLDLAPNQFQVHINPAGVALWGDVSLYTDHFHLFLSPPGYISSTAEGGQFYYRTVQHRRDYTGGRNIWRPLTLLTDPRKLADELRAIQRSATCHTT